MNSKLVIAIVFSLVLLSCKKEEQSCSDGVFNSAKEEQTDCGGVCPPCNSSSSSHESDPYLFAEINSESVSFADFSLTKTSDWILKFQNDSITVFLNLGDGDSLGNRSIKIPNSKATYKNVDYSSLTGGKVLFSEIDHSENLLSGYFEAEFVSDIMSTDTLKITGGQFGNIGW